MNKAFLVTGPESSGTCYMTRLLIGSGCAGVAGGPQPFDGPEYSIAFPDGQELPPLLAIQRSMPHAGEWPDIADILKTLWEHEYDVTVLIMVRDGFSQEASYQRTFRTKTHAEYMSLIAHAWVKIFAGITRGLYPPFVVVPYQSLGCPHYRKWLADALGLPPFVEPFIDGDAQYKEGETCSI